MNTKIIAIVALIIVVLLGAGGFFVLNQNKSATNTPTPTQKTDDKTTQSLIDLLKSGQSQRCTFKTEMKDSSSEGTFYVSSGNARGDFKVTDKEGKTTETSIIRKDDYNYIWGGGLEMGIKMKLTLDQLSTDTNASQYVDPNQKVNYSCTGWTVDQSLFTPPSNIKFQDMSQLLEKVMGPTGTKTMPDSSVCDQITDPTAKSACQNALKGN